ncbi:hypothetical protein H4582DRAFT_1003918 [Lactarius indigo]|nr:hypothetical protein H4582DRAFT_1003918 [Lactarius indigo]
MMMMRARFGETKGGQVGSGQRGPRASFCFLFPMQLSKRDMRDVWFSYQRVHLFFTHTQQRAPFPTGFFDAQYIAVSGDAARFLGTPLTSCLYRGDKNARRSINASVTKIYGGRSSGELCGRQSRTPSLCLPVSTHEMCISAADLEHRRTSDTDHGWCPRQSWWRSQHRSPIFTVPSSLRQKTVVMPRTFRAESEMSWHRAPPMI